MPSISQVSSLKISPLVHDPKSTKVDFGAVVEGVDLNTLDSDTFEEIKKAVFTHKVLIIKGQGRLAPENQLKFVQRFSPGSTNFSHALDPDYIKRRGNKSTTIPDVPQCQVLGYGRLPPNHYGLPNDFDIDRQDHTHMHKDPLTPEEIAEGYTRLMQLHFDGALYNIPPPLVGSLLAVRTPKGPELTLRFDNPNGRGDIKCGPGSTAYFNASMAYKLLTDEQRQICDHSFVTYAPHAFTWISKTKFTSDGSSIVTEGKEIPLDELAAWEESKLKTMPMVWANPLNGERSLMVHGQVAMKLHLRSSPDDDFEVVDDLAKVRAFLQSIMLPILRPEYVYLHHHLEGDLAVWYNQGMWHSITEPPECKHDMSKPEECSKGIHEDGLCQGRRIMHQCNLGHTVDPVAAIPQTAPVVCRSDIRPAA